MINFKQVKGAVVLVRTRAGVYKELDIYKYSNELFAKSGSGFYKLYTNLCTSADSVKWSKIAGVEHKPSTKGGLTYVRLVKL